MIKIVLIGAVLLALFYKDLLNIFFFKHNQRDLERLMMVFTGFIAQPLASHAMSGAATLQTPPNFRATLQRINSYLPQQERPDLPTRLHLLAQGVQSSSVKIRQLCLYTRLRYDRQSIVALLHKLVALTHVCPDTDPQAAKQYIYIAKNLGYYKDAIRVYLDEAARFQPPPDPLLADYQLLGAKAQMSDDAIRKAYHRAIKNCHPDRARPCSPEEQQRITEQAARINAAYQRIKTARRIH